MKTAKGLFGLGLLLEPKRITFYELLVEKIKVLKKDYKPETDTLNT